MVKALLIWYALSGFVLFALMGLDKGKAKRERWRVSETTLFAWALLGGAAGGWLGMRVFHHKTLHFRFRYGFPLLTLAHAAVLLWLALRPLF